MKINQNYLNVGESYLFSTISTRIGAYLEQNPGADIIRMGIGDVTLPLCPAVTKALHAAVDEMGEKTTFRGYGPEQGYGFLKEAVRDRYAQRGVELAPDEIFIGDGAKSDIANFLDILGTDNTVMVPDPVYPVYLDTNIMSGRKVLFAKGSESNSFLPMPDASIEADLIYLCSPNNPTGSVYSHDQLKAWVDYATKRGGLILFDAAYECFVQDPSLPHSIFEIPGARSCAVEFCSFSKSAGFTGTRCSYTVVSDELEFGGVKLAKLWLRRQTTKFNGVPYIVQRGAAAVLSPEGQAQTKEQVAYYLNNAKTIRDTLRAKNVWFVGGENAPYIWMKCPDGMDSWQYFDLLLQKASLVGTPGAGFGPAGEGYFRLTAFGDKDRTREAMHRLEKL